VLPQGSLPELLHWEQVVLQQAQHYQAVPLILINLKGCPQGPTTQQLVADIKVGGWAGEGLVVGRAEAGPHGGKW